MADSDRADWIVPTQIAVGNGASIFIQVPVIAGQIYVDVIPAVGGGSLYIAGYGISRGATSSLGQKALTPTLVLAASFGFGIPYATAPYRVSGPAAFWLAAGGATVVVQLAYGCRNTSNEL